MAGKLITAEEAATMLGVSVSELLEMRQRLEVNGLKDGSSWKFKQEEIQRVAQERGGRSTQSPGLSGIAIPVDLDDDSAGVLSEFELGDSGPGSSTVIGGKKKPDSDLKLVDSGPSLAGDSGLNLMDDDLRIAESSIKMSTKGDDPAGSDVHGGSGSGLDLLGSDVSLAAPDASNVLSDPGEAGGSMASGRTMLTAELMDKPAAESSVKLTMRDENVLGDEGSDVTRNVSGSGINLLDPKDSGMLLDDLDLTTAGSGIRKGSDLDLKGDDDFLLTPLPESGDDSTDSGSQVIALDENFSDDATATLLAGDVPGLGAALEEEGFGQGFGQAGGMVPAYAMGPDTKFGAISVVMLSLCAVVMTLTGVMLYDIIRQMWAWDQPYSVDSTLIELIPGLK